MNLRIIADTVAILKNIPRTGWLQKGIPSYEAETVAEHTFEVTSILTILSLAVDENIDKAKILQMGMIHDISEAVLGDIPKAFTDRVGKEAKTKTEQELVEELSKSSELTGFKSLFDEYADRKSSEAVLVKISDLAATIRQAKAYHERGFPVQDILEGCKRELETLLHMLSDERVNQIITELV
ncbi:MAG: HD domain-containing protein [Nitrososphaeria archaeon]